MLIRAAFVALSLFGSSHHRNVATKALVDTYRMAPAESTYFACIRHIENGGRYIWGFNPPTWGGDGGGAYQFEPGTWYSNDPWGYVWGEATPWQQDRVADYTYKHDGRQPWAGDSCP